MKLELRMLEVEDSEEYGLILAGLREFNNAQGKRDRKALTLALFDSERKIVAGLNGVTDWGWLYVEHLWVRDDHRGEGLGRDLLAKAEMEAKSRGCRHVYLDTFSFQAPAFYEKQGYTQYAKLDDFPGKHSRHFFKKDLN